MDDYSEENYKKLKRRLREVMQVNETMTRDYELARKKVKTLTYERNLLLDNIAQRENLSDDNSSTSSHSSLLSSGSETESDAEESTVSTLAPSKASRLKRNRASSDRDPTTVASAPPKRSKPSRALPRKLLHVQPIELEENGQPKLPQKIGVLNVLKLGEIEYKRDTFHNDRYIFPIGYTVSRSYPSMVDATKNTMITSTIIDGGDHPRFRVDAEDMPNEPIIANSATGAWTVVVRRSNEIRNRDHSNSASGPDYYGFKHPTIAKMIQDLPNTEKLASYIRKEFKNMDPRAAKGVMAAADKKRENLEKMGNANLKVAKEDSASIVEEDDDNTHTTNTPTAGSSPQMVPMQDSKKSVEGIAAPAHTN